MFSRRPASVTLYALVVLSIAAFYLARFYGVLAQWKYLQDLLPFSPAYLAATGLFWGLAGLLLSWCLWSGWRRARQLFWLIFVGHGIYFWLDRLLMPGDPERNANDLFWIGSFILVVLVSIWALHRRKLTAFFIRDLSGRVVTGAKNE
jgi:hypothetical protein